MAHPHPTCQLHFPVDGRTTLAPPATRMCDGHHKMSLFAARRDAEAQTGHPGIPDIVFLFPDLKVADNGVGEIYFLRHLSLV